MRHATLLYLDLHRLGATYRFGGMAGLHFAVRVLMRTVAGRVF